MNTSPWLIFDRPPTARDTVLFCLHHAGGNAAVFRTWQAQAPDNVIICRIQLPGHGTRMQEPLLTHMSDVLDGLVQTIRPWLGHAFALFGHSFGGTVAAELTLRLQAENLPLPTCLFLSASEPSHRVWTRPCHNLPSAMFREYLFRLGGTPREVLEEEELMNLIEPVIRADYAILETWAPKPVRSFRVPVMAFAGNEDRIVPCDIVRQWEDFSTHSFNMKVLPGNHFYIHSEEKRLLSYIFEILEKYNPKGDKNDTK